MGRKPAKPWAKLDFDWFEDDDVATLEIEHGARAALDWAKLIAIWADFENALIDCKKPGVWRKLKTKLQRNDRSLEDYLDVLAGLGLIDRAAWAEFRVVTNERAADNARARQGQRGGKRDEDDAVQQAAP